MADGEQELQAIVRAVLRPMFRSIWRIRVTGVENIPATGGAILTPNHTSVIDSFFLPAAARAGQLCRQGRVSRRLEDSQALSGARHDPDRPQRRRRKPTGARYGRSSSRKRRPLAIYPEGTRSRSGFLHKGHTGAARLSIRTGCPIVPVGIKGARSIQPPDQPVPNVFRPVEIHFGTPIHPAASDSVSDQRLRLRQITDEVMFEIRALTGQDYVNEYAGKTPPPAAQAPHNSLARDARAAFLCGCPEARSGVAPPDFPQQRHPSGASAPVA